MAYTDVCWDSVKGDMQFYIGVKALIVNSEGKVLILKSIPREASHTWEPYWDLPGGKIRNEAIEDTLLREINEEIGVKEVMIGMLCDAAISNFKINDGKDNLMFPIYKCRVPEGAELRLSKEHGEFKWADAEEAAKSLSVMLPERSLDNICRYIK